MIQTIPKLLQAPLVPSCPTGKNKYRPPVRQAVCRFPDCYNNPCKHSRCEETDVGYNCHCATGYNGKNCVEDIDECASTPCKNGGTCVDDVNMYTCTCVAGYTGTECASPSAKVFVTDINAGVILVSEFGDELNFTTIPSTSEPWYLAYDSTEKLIYWSDWDRDRVYRANVNGTNREQVTHRGTFRYYGIAIAEKSRVLYIACYASHKVTSMSIESGSILPGSETDFVNRGITDPRALTVDEEQGYLYISRDYGITRALLNTTNHIEEIYRDRDLADLTGLSIDLTGNPRRIFFCDWNKRRAFYKDVITGPNSSTSSAVELTEHLQNPNQQYLRDVKFFGGNLYFVKGDDPKGIGIMTDYDQTNPSYKLQEISQFQDPHRMLITSVES